MSEWIHIKLGEVGSFNNGINKGNKSFGYGVPFVNLLDVFNKSSISHIPNDLVDASETEISAYSLKKGDILFVRSSVKPEGVGKTCVVLCELPRTVYSGFIIRFRQNEAIFDVGYSKYCFDCTTFRKQILSYSTVSANTNINQVSLKKLGIKIPKFLNEQRKIARILSTIDAVIEKTEAAIAKFKAIKAGMMRDLFTRGIDLTTGKLRQSYEEAPELYKQSELGWVPREWDVSRIGDLINIKHGYSFKSKYFSDEWSDYILLTPGNFHVNGDLYFEERNTKYYTGEIPPDYVFVNCDLLVVMTDLTRDMNILGNVVKLHSSQKVLHNQRIGKIEIKKHNVVDDYLLEVMNTHFSKENIKKNATGTTVRHTSPTNIYKGVVPLPRESEQKMIFEKINSFRKIVSEEELLYYKCQRLKQALMSDLLTGNVRVKYEEEKEEVA